MDPYVEQIIKRLYCRKGESNWNDVVSRVSSTLAQNDAERMDFKAVLSEMIFLPNSPTLMNAGVKNGQLAGCFVLPVEDHIEGIFDAVKWMALVHKTGGGTGFSFSGIREDGADVRESGGCASGPISFMRIFDAVTKEIKQGGRRRGANMAVLDINHLDIEKFINAKLSGEFQNFNFSVMVNDAFMVAVENDIDFELVSRVENGRRRIIKARALWNQIVNSAWLCGDPGILFGDTINDENCLIKLGRIKGTNPCGEQPLLPFEVCNLGAINLTKFVKDEEFKIKEFIEAVKIAVRFLNRVIDCNCFPLEQIKDMVNGTRKIGLGVMGLADFFILLKIRYGEIESLDLANKVFEILAKEAWEESLRLGIKLGSFGKANLWEKKKDYQLQGSRNSAITTVAPTGTTSIILGVSSGIEPLFRVKYKRTDTFGTREIVHPLFERIDYNKYSKYVRVAEEIEPFEHLEMQATIQKWVDSAVSKTINLKNSATVEDIAFIYKTAWEKKCKGVTIFRQGSKKGVME